jgi:hypothetical protein
MSGERRESTPGLSTGVLGLMQFSRSTEATHGVIPPASLKTEQRPRRTNAPGPSPVDVSRSP